VGIKGVLPIFDHTCGVDDIEVVDGVLGEGMGEGKRAECAK
jgi:hypothetical protein